MLIHKYFNKTYLALFVIILTLPSLLFANDKGFSSQEIQRMQLSTQKQLNSEAIQRWVKTIQHYNPSEAVSRSQPITKRRNTLMIFVSFSMSEKSLRQYLAEGQKIKASLLLRGLVNNSLTATVKKIHNVIQRRNGGFSIDPIAFEKLHIRKVPAIVLFNQAGLICLNTQNCIPDPSDYDILYGNVTLDYALSQFANGDDAISTDAKKLLEQLRDNNNV